MTKAFTFLFAISISLASYGQFFEGKIVYKNSFKSKMPSITDEQFTLMMGSTQNYYIKGGNYKSISNGSLSGWLLYVNEDNKLYSKSANSDTVSWNDGATFDDEVLSASFNKGATKILGYTCDELILECKSGLQKYYFNSVLSADAALYKNHKYGNWYDYLSKSNSLPLKMTIDMPHFSMESIAMEIIPLNLEAAFFELPANATTIKSRY